MPRLPAVEALDGCLARILPAIEDRGGCLRADGRSRQLREQMWDDTLKAPHTAHTSNPVPFVIAGPGRDPTLRSGGALCDVAPTILGLMGLPLSADMTGLILRRL